VFLQRERPTVPAAGFLLYFQPVINDLKSAANAFLMPYATCTLPAREGDTHAQIHPAA
jgi:hypothetical protein